MNSQNINSESNRAFTHEEAMAMKKQSDPVVEFDARLIERLGGDVEGATYKEYSSDHALQTVKVEGQDGWLVVGQAENNAGDVILKLGRLDDDANILTTSATPEQLVAWNTPEKAEVTKTQSDMGRIGLRLGGFDASPSTPLEVVDAPVAQLPPETRFAQLLNPDDDGLTDQQRIEAAAVYTSSDTEKEYAAMNAARREADHKYNLAQETERIRFAKD